VPGGRELACYERRTVLVPLIRLRGQACRAIVCMSCTLGGTRWPASERTSPCLKRRSH
jgi:hypothetical protein